MKPYTRSIIDLFDGTKRYLIPLYQRQYAWRIEPQLRLLWEDIMRANQQLVSDRASLSPHFMGAMVIAQIKTFGEQVQAYEVIDGQQRLTTFQLLLAALRDVALANGSAYSEEIRRYLLNDGIMESPERERYKVWPSLTDRRAFVSMIDPAADLDAIAKHSAEEDGYVRRAVSAHAWFRERIEQHVGKGDAYQNELLKKLFEALRYGLAVVSIELEGSDDPQTIFETLNSRGVDLTPGDLMRNFIFQRAKGMGQDEASLVVDKLYENYWLPLDGAFWQHLATRGRQSANRMDWMLTDHLSMKLADIVSKENLFDLYRRWILDAKPFASIEAELEAISKSASVERRIFERDKNDSIGRFGLFAEAFDVTTVFPLVVYLATEGNDDDQLDAALAMLESFILRRDICGLPNKNYNKFFVSTVAHLRAAAGSKVDALHTWLASRASDLDRWPDDEEWRRGWLGRDQYKSARQPRLRYLFEHIMPQQWRIHWPVPGFDHLDEDEIDAEQMTAEMHRSGCINKLGNLTLITQPLNSSVSHGPFSVKMPALRAYSSLALNRELEEFDQWDETSVARRGNTLFDVAGKVWLPPSSGL